MIFLYPNMMFEKTVDPEFLEEMIESENMGNVVCTTKDARVKSVHPQKTIFRGWMKTEALYIFLQYDVIYCDMMNTSISTYMGLK